ncbi:hypothetical protein Mpet_2464 [Methanolacinia petrolearia DSM 11571]|uniref:Thioredoxin domain-containing protein n=1 Tax=Methanolacinia petrolearia (strain DSM 11571 / OCM 486 / SEBR 4847) TaxID=679926 RepID=E1REG5_METP4|nr:thioredoxin family protein [Methanolacinia petrolearia]ADN37208.1 hypothetical protein Mpet_2464 [Methanolacinia petrolearia DSM 11571]
MQKTKFLIALFLILIVSIQAVQAYDGDQNISQNYSQKVAAANTTVTVFYSSHCISCDRVIPFIENLTESYPEIEVNYLSRNNQPAFIGDGIL